MTCLQTGLLHLQRRLSDPRTARQGQWRSNCRGLSRVLSLSPLYASHVLLSFAVAGDKKRSVSLYNITAWALSTKTLKNREQGRPEGVGKERYRHPSPTLKVRLIARGNFSHSIRAQKNLSSFLSLSFLSNLSKGEHHRSISIKEITLALRLERQAGLKKTSIARRAARWVITVMHDQIKKSDDHAAYALKQQTQRKGNSALSLLR